MSPAAVDLLIGRNREGTPFAGAFSFHLFSGLMDELKLYTRVLSAEEVKRQYAEDLLPHGGVHPRIPYEELKLDRSLLAGDRHRPQYHVSPPAHWMNEPHAPVYYNGQYHLFYQHNPKGPFFHYLHWGHWVSPDLVHWRDLPVALTPENNGLNPDGVWSGSAAYDADGEPALFFTAGNDRVHPNQRVGLARSTYRDNLDNDLVHWKVCPDPILIQDPAQKLTGDFRDPFVWKTGDTWYLLIGSGTVEGSGTVVAYSSKDMISWRNHGLFLTADRQKYPYLGPVWELPVLLPLGRNRDGEEKHLFLVSPVGEGRTWKCSIGSAASIR
ncbi:hypothetical protein N6H14_04345 [Paenibacillus sp. CC-CFT747]|nr:hypothetical protein N6H14_04345 [Paenibacillus sp. CC-CFT747]